MYFNKLFFQIQIVKAMKNSKLLQKLNQKNLRFVVAAMKKLWICFTLRPVTMKFVLTVDLKTVYNVYFVALTRLKKRIQSSKRIFPYHTVMLRRNQSIRIILLMWNVSIFLLGKLFSFNQFIWRKTISTVFLNWTSNTVKSLTCDSFTYTEICLALIL